MHSKMADASLLFLEGLVNMEQIATQARAHKQDSICVVSGSF